MEIREEMEVIDSDGQHVGIVKSVEGERIKLIKKDAVDPKHAFVDKSQIARIDGNKIMLSEKVSAVTTRAWVSPER